VYDFAKRKKLNNEYEKNKKQRKNPAPGVKRNAKINPKRIAQKNTHTHTPNKFIVISTRNHASVVLLRRSAANAMASGERKRFFLSLFSSDPSPSVQVATIIGTFH
jgi:hypothetical protein